MLTLANSNSNSLDADADPDRHTERHTERDAKPAGDTDCDANPVTFDHSRHRCPTERGHLFVSAAKTSSGCLCFGVSAKR